LKSAQSPSSTLAGRARGSLLVIFLLSLVGLAYEVTLTRLFSVIFQYHYVFLIVSISIAGLSVGAAAATWRAQRTRDANYWSQMLRAALLLVLLLVVVGVLIGLVTSSSQMLLILLAALLPFVVIGFMNATLFARFAREGGTLYAADLAGGAVGVTVALAGIGWLGAFDAVFALAAASAAVAVVIGWINANRSQVIIAVTLTVLVTVGTLINHQTQGFAFSPGRISDAPPDKTMMRVLQDPTAAIVETRWDPFARLDTVVTGDDSLRYVFTDAGAGSIMLRYDGDDADIAWMRSDIEYLPFAADAEPPASVLILGAGAGRDILMAKLAGAESITAVEINPTLVQLTQDAASYNGGVYELPGVQTVIMDGRNYVERSTSQYDLIYANVVYSQAAAPGHSGLSENYIFTREALRAYWQHLADDGRMGFVTHQGIEGIRLVIAALDMLQAEGLTIAEALQRVSMASLAFGEPETRTTVILVQRQPWTQATASAYAAEVHSRNSGALYLPFYQELGFESLAAGLISLEGYIASNTDFNYAPSTDDRPFFYQLRPGLPPGLSDLLLIGLLLTAAYLSWLVFFFVRRDEGQWKRASLAPYFALLGVAFLLVEIPQIQRFSLLLGQPVLALVTVIGTLLISSGLGSLFSSRLELLRLPRAVMRLCIALSIMVFVTTWLYPLIIQWALPFDLSIRVLVTALALMPLGLLMGIPFPSGLRVAHQADPKGIAAFWGANAIASVLGSALAMVLAVWMGFSATLWIGALLYALAGALIFFTWRRLLI
jgi:hypothetical protein